MLWWWLSADSVEEVGLRVPGCDDTPAVTAESLGPVKVEGVLEVFDGVASKLMGDWPCFRGGNLDGICVDRTPIAKSWSEGGPKTLWAIDVGEGYAGAAIYGGKVYIIDYDRDKQLDVVRCLSLDDGKDIWSYSYPVKLKRWHGMSRTVPAVTDKYIVTMGPKCHVTCLDSQTGEFLWMYNLPRELATEVPQWYAGQCPIIENGKAIIASGGDCLMMSIDCKTGEIDWKTPNPDGWQMTHCSIAPMEFGGRKLWIYCASGGVVGVSADDGSVVFKTDVWNMRTNVPTPVPVDGGQIFLSAGYNKGAMMLKLSEQGGKVSAEVVFSLKQKVFGAEQHTPIFYKGYIYGVRMDDQLVCLDLEGNIVWSSTSSVKFGKGPYVIVDDMIFIGRRF